MGGALDQAGAGIEELIRLPFQGDSSVRALIGIHVGLPLAAHGKELQARKLETPATGLGKVTPGAKKFHVYPLGPKALR
ncbi:hypothetical protein PproGo58_49760 [Pseudomonas protegens]|nr:hypothetical protein PproGo58_49760 [Pseudomonas protegens]